jgi:hypothetical protein
MMSSIKRLPEEQRKFIEKLLREDRLTLNEMLDEIRAEFPTDDSKSFSIGRKRTLRMKQENLEKLPQHLNIWSKSLVKTLMIKAACCWLRQFKLL